MPPEGTKFDGVICTQVLNSIPDADMHWVRERLESYATKFCFIGVNFQREAKSKKSMYDPAHFHKPRTREFFVATIKTGKAVICSGGGKIAHITMHGSMIS